MPEFSINYTLQTFGDRDKVRMAVVNELSKEAPGNGGGSLASRYTYYVETLRNGDRVYLRRPANLHNGFDFVVCVENCNFNPTGRKRNYPTHDDIINDLKSKKAEDRLNYGKLFELIKRVYNCQSVPQTEMMLNFTNGYSSELIIKTIKWLFIEQDIRYWNYSGRDMLWNRIKSI